MRYQVCKPPEARMVVPRSTFESRRRARRLFLVAGVLCMAGLFEALRMICGHDCGLRFLTSELTSSSGPFELGSEL